MKKPKISRKTEPRSYPAYQGYEKNWGTANANGPARSLEYCIDQCEKLAAQLQALGAAQGQ